MILPQLASGWSKKSRLVDAALCLVAGVLILPIGLLWMFLLSLVGTVMFALSLLHKAGMMVMLNNKNTP
jgi:hypothetical protein